MPLLTYPDSRVVCGTLALLETILDFGNTHVQEGLRDLTRLKQTKVLPILTELLKRGAVVHHETCVIVLLNCLKYGDRRREITTRAVTAVSKNKIRQCCMHDHNSNTIIIVSA